MNNMINQRLANLRKREKGGELEKEQRRMDRVFEDNIRKAHQEFESEKLRRRVFKDGVEGQLREKEEKRRAERREKEREVGDGARRERDRRESEVGRRIRERQKKSKYLGDIQKQLRERERARSVGGISDVEQYSGNHYVQSAGSTHIVHQSHYISHGSEHVFIIQPNYDQDLVI